MLALYNGKATSIIQNIQKIESFSSNGRWRTVTKFRRRFWYSLNPFGGNDISAVTLDSGDLLILGGGEWNLEINKLKNDGLTRIGTLQTVFV